MSIFDILRKHKAFNQIRYKLINKRLIALEISNLCIIGYLISKNLY